MDMTSVSQAVNGGSGSVNPLAGTATPSRDDTISQVGEVASVAIAGGAASYKFSSQFSSTIKSGIEAVHTSEPGIGNKMKASLPSIKSAGITTVKAGGMGAIISGAVSAITNGIEVIQGKKTGGEAVGTMVADTASGTIGAMAGVATGGLATFALSSMLGTTPLMIVGVSIGAIGAVLSDKLFKGVGAYDAIRNAVKNMFTK